MPLRTANGPDSCVIIHASPLLEALCWLFESIWARAVPVADVGRGGRGVRADVGASGGGDDECSPDAERQRLLRLLAAGASDSAIARQLGWSNRTLYRRLARVFQELGVTTRFQAGVQAARLGWL